MPRPRKPDGREPKSRSRNGCWSCKARKVKCTEERPNCSKCIKGGYQCDYGIRLKWDGRCKRPQLKAVHLGQVLLADGDDPDHDHDPDPDPDPTADDGLDDQQESFSVNVPAIFPPRHPPRPQAQLEMQFQLDPTIAPVVLSDVSAGAGSFASFGAPAIVAPAPTSQTSQPGMAAAFASTMSPPSPNQTRTAQVQPLPASSVSSAFLHGSMDDGMTYAEPDYTQNAAKRQRIGSEGSENEFAWTWPMSPSTGSGSLSATSPRLFASANASANASATFPRLSEASPRPDLLHLQANDFRRLSVTSLLSRTGEQEQEQDHEEEHDDHHHHRYYGIDAGFVDLDLAQNDDYNALKGKQGLSPLGKRTTLVHSPAHDPGGFYARPVPVRIPRGLGKLPAKLTDNPMNLLYFHHFINNTARVLVPHDDPFSNPFRTILAQMALNNDNLLSLLLAYSASHRARVLQQQEPCMRIALWVQDIFPALRQSLDDASQKISNANVATAIMLCSLAIVSPTAFGYDIPWQRHLVLARNLISSRPEGLRVEHHSSPEGQVCSFLWSWFAYLDVLGGLGDGPNDASPAWILDYKVYDPKDDDEIDCVMGFTTRCIYILSQIAHLVRECEPQRLRDGPSWTPGDSVEDRVASLDVDVRDSMAQAPRPCSHLHHQGDVSRWDCVEMAATNEAYHWAALLHLHRRVLGKRTTDAEIQLYVQKIATCLDLIHVGGTAENCWLFPLFTAACESTDAAQRRFMLARLTDIEGSGMAQVARARKLVQRAWDTGQPWETLLSGEFLG